MIKIIDGDEIFKHIWEDTIDGYFGCENCSLKGKNICPSDCNPDKGCYRYMDFREIKYIKLLERWKEKHNKLEKRTI